MDYSGNHLRVLIIEENEGDYIIIEELLNAEFPSSEIKHARTFSDAALLLKANEQCDAILLDLTLPDARGEKLVQNIIGLAKQTPVIVLTGYSDKNFGIKTLALGVADYLLKDELSGLQLAKSISYAIERTKINRQLQQSEEKYRNLFQFSPLPMIVLKKDTFKILDVNNPALTFYGYTKEEALAMTVLDFLPGEHHQKFINFLYEIKQQDKKIDFGIHTHLKRSGEQARMEVSGHFIQYQEKDCLMVICHDVTERERYLNELTQLNISLEQKVQERTQELQDANKELKTFNYSVSHDLRNPLNAMGIFVSLLEKPVTQKLNDKELTYLQQIKKSIHNMNALIDDLLSFSNAGKAELRVSRINLSKLAREVVDGLMPDAASVYHPEIIIKDSPDSFGDYTLIRQTLINLFSNALKYSGNHKKPVITMEAKPEKEMIQYRITDNGIGFDMKDAEQLFKPFCRLENSAGFPGTGIGLSIVARIISRHGGKVWAESKPGAGSRFYFTLPAVVK